MLGLLNKSRSDYKNKDKVNSLNILSNNNLLVYTRIYTRKESVNYKCQCIF